MKEKILIAVTCLIAGVVIGFMFANSVNRTDITAQTASASPAQPGDNSGLPPNHPPLGQSGNTQDGGAIPEVMAAIEKAKQQPNDFEAQMTAGDLYYQIQRFADAAKFYEAANRLRPQDVESMIKTGNAMFDHEQFEQAEKWYLKALELRPKDTNVRSDLGLTFFLREPRDIDRAIKEFQFSLSIDPDHEMTLQNLAIVYTEKGDKSSARQTIDRLKKVNPSNPAIPKLEAGAAT